MSNELNQQLSLLPPDRDPTETGSVTKGKHRGWMLTGQTTTLLSGEVVVIGQ